VNQSDSYKTLLNPSEGLYKDKGSKFFAFAYPIENEDIILNYIQQLKLKYHDARHHCYAYSLGYNREKYRTFDDGEPSGTAGKPIYGQILSHNLHNVLIVVVRYFGGTLLGTGGLIKAYSSAANIAIENATIVEKIIGQHITLQCSYTQLSTIKYLIKINAAEIVEQHFDNRCELKIMVRKSNYSFLINQLKQIENISITSKEKD
jgi:uncharacterized YigZ family protein